tara:strand:- start:283 stop:1074 length:792 start_codon:yes stop_codon:yes gene_type:complete
MTQNGLEFLMMMTSGKQDGGAKWRIEMIFWIVLFGGLGAYGYYLSRLQPFPEIGGRFAAVLLFMALILWIASTSPRDTEGDLPAVVSVFLGGVFVISGIGSMSITKTDVIVAPLGGILFCVGGIYLLSARWEFADQSEQIGSFILASTMVTIELYLAFRGLVLGVPGIAWSKSGLRQIHRGLLLGPNGAIAHFEKSWDMEEQWINSMSFAALILIHRHLGNSTEEAESLEELEKLGGWRSVDSSWTAVIEKGLSSSITLSEYD